MLQQTDPFAHHPELRGRIADPETSFFRGFSIERVIEQFPEMEEHRDWAHTDEVREANRAAALKGHEGDLWVFGYGSLMWDPALCFAEVRRACIRGFARRLILMDDKGGRGSEDAPGLMAALDFGDCCEGLAFRIAAADVDRETEILWRREIIGPGYIPQFVTAELDDREVRALTFVADHDVDMVMPDLPREVQVRYIATGCGFLGTSREYLANIVSHFEALGIHDAHCADLLAEVDAYVG